MIDQEGIGEAALSQPAAYYIRLFGTPRRDRLPEGLDRLIFDAHEIAVLFRPGTREAVGLITWSSRYITPLLIGPCSRTKTLRSAYSGKLQTVATGPHLIALRLGRLVFAADPDERVNAVLLSSELLSPLLALGAPACGVPGI